jgi:hypothetical protein
MDIQMLNRSDAEKIFLNIYNISGATLTTNAAVNLACDGDSVDGIGAIQPATASKIGWVGIVNEDIADTGYGRAQCWGYRDSVLLSHEGTSITVTIGDCLYLVNGQQGVNTSNANLSTLTEKNASELSKYVVCATTTTISAAAYCKGIIRCL